MFGAEFLFWIMENEQKIEVEFESNEKDFQRVLLWYHWKRMSLEFGLIILLGILFCYFLGFNVLDFKNNGWAAFAFFATISISFALDIYRRCFITANKLKEIAKPSKTTFSEQGIESKTPTTSSKEIGKAIQKFTKPHMISSFFRRKMFLQLFQNDFSKTKSKLKN